jgi:hypothetical protein
LAGDGGRDGCAREARLLKDECVLKAHLAGTDLRLRAQRRAIAALGAQKKAGQEHDSTLEHELGRDGTYPFAVQGATTARVFEAYVEQVLAPSLRAGQVVLMDNLGAHRPKRVRELIEGRGCEL